MKLLSKQILAISIALSIASTSVASAASGASDMDLYGYGNSNVDIRESAATAPAMEIDEIVISYDESYASPHVLAPYSIDRRPCASELLEDDLKSIGIEAVDNNICADGSMLMTARSSYSDAEGGSLGNAGAPAGNPSIDDMIDEVESLNDHIRVQPNYSYEFFGASTISAPNETFGIVDASLLTASTPNDPYTYISSPGADQNQYWCYSTELIDAWSKACSNHSVTIALFDTGIMMSHEDLSDNVLSQYAYDAYNLRPYIETPEETIINRGHGTHVAGIASAAANNSMGIAGASYNANILPIKVNNATSTRTSMVVAGYRYVMKLAEDHPELNIRVANMSLGATNANDALLHEAIIKARYQYGIITVCAGGNGKDGIPRTDLVYPADYEECVSVTALTTNGYNCFWSDYNSEKDISAPGEAIVSTLPNTATTFGKMSGTSMASPMVAGTIALMISAVPNASVNDILNSLYESADRIYDPNNDRSAVSGSHGALNANRAVESLIDKYSKQSSFNDVAIGSWYFDTVESINALGVMTGYGDSGSFKPESVMTRAEAAEALYKYLGNKAIAPSCNMGDVNQGEWYAKAINWAVDKGIMRGYTGGANDGNFGPNDLITREQIACVIASISGDDLSKSNSDKFYSLINNDKTSDWAFASMIWAVDNGVINGIGGIDLNPGGMLQRCEMAQILLNSINAGII